MANDAFALIADANFGAGALPKQVADDIGVAGCRANDAAGAMGKAMSAQFFNISEIRT